MTATRFATLCAIGAALSPTLFADTITTPEIVVTATRTPVDTSQVAASTTVITRDDIEARQVESVPELLMGVAGIDVTQSGGPGKTASVFLRGAESDHVLVLINGIRTGSTSLGSSAFEQLPVEHIERVEIVRGPRASQWGSEAIGGVIQIFTRSGEDLASGDTDHEVGAGGGSFSTRKGHAATAGRTGATHYQASVGYLNTNGFDARQPVPGEFGFDQPDDDGYENLSVHLRGGHKITDSLDVDAFLLRAAGTTEFDGSFQDEVDFVQQVAGARAEWNVTESSALRLRVGQSRDEQENFAPDGSFSSRFDSQRDEASLVADFRAAAGHLVNIGVDYRDDRIDSNNEFAESSRDNAGVFAQFFGSLGDHNLTASVRHDDNEAFGSKTTGGLGWSARLPSRHKLYASYGTAFKTPSFNELYFPGFGNPDLDPETSQSIELGLEGRPSWGWWSVRAYRTEIDDLIATVFDPDSGEAFSDNVDEAEINGIEAAMRTRVADYAVRASLNLMDPEDKETGNQLPRRPRSSLTVDVTRSFDRLRVGGRLIAQGDRFDNVDNTVEVDGFVTVNLAADYELRPGLFLRGRIGNLFDEDYETVATFNSADRHVLVSLLYRSQP